MLPLDPIVYSESTNYSVGKQLTCQQRQITPVKNIALWYELHFMVSLEEMQSEKNMYIFTCNLSKWKQKFFKENKRELYHAKYLQTIGRVY